MPAHARRARRTAVSTTPALGRLVLASPHRYRYPLAQPVDPQHNLAFQIAEIIEKGKIKPACLQVESHPFFAQDKLITFCKERDIVVTAYSPLGTGSSIDGATIASHPALAKVSRGVLSSARMIAL